MAGNTNPIFSKVGDIQWSGPVLAANTALDGTGAVATVFTGDPTNGSYVAKIRAKALGANITTVVRIFINNGASPAVAANNVLFDEFNLPASNASNANAQQGIDFPLGIMLPPGYKLMVALGSAVSSGWNFTGVGGKF